MAYPKTVTISIETLGWQPMITKIDLSEYIMNDGKLRSYTPIGGYPLSAQLGQ